MLVDGLRCDTECEMSGGPSTKQRETECHGSNDLPLERPAVDTHGGSELGECPKPHEVVGQKVGRHRCLWVKPSDINRKGSVGAHLYTGDADERLIRERLSARASREPRDDRQIKIVHRKFDGGRRASMRKAPHSQGRTWGYSVE